MCPLPTPCPSIAPSPSSIPCLFLVPFLFSLSLFPLFYFLSSCPIHLYSVSHSASFITCLPVLLLFYLSLTLFLFTLSLIQLFSVPACLSYWLPCLPPCSSIFCLSFSFFHNPVCLPYYSFTCLSALFLSFLPLFQLLPLPVCPPALFLRLFQYTLSLFQLIP